MKPVVVSDVLAVGELPTPEQIEILAKAGFKSLLNNQPDGEVERFPASSALEAEAKRNGLAYAYAPLSTRTPPADELERYAAALQALPAPIYAFCYSGARSAAGCALLLTERFEVDALIRDFGEGGFDLEALRPWLVEERARHTGKQGSAPSSVAATAVVEGAPKAANGNGHHARNGTNGATDSSEVAAEPAVKKPEAAAGGMPRMVVVMPRAASYGGYAM